MAVVQFPVQQVRALVGALDREGFVVLSGPAGSGKLTLLQQAFPRLSVIRLEAEVNVTNVEKIARSLQPSMNEDGYVVQPIWAMGPAELVTQPAVATLRRIVLRRKQQVVLLSCEKVHGVAREAIVYHKGLDNEARVRLATNWGASAANVRNIVKACGTDLRQLQLAATFGSGGTDSAAHVWMDTRAILSGAPKSTDYYSVDWLEHNVLESLAPSQLDGAAAFYGSLALADSLGNGGNGFLLAMRGRITGGRFSSTASRSTS